MATRGSWAMVKNEGNYAYIRTSDLTTADAAPDYSELLYPHILANGNIPPDFLLRSRESDYCRAVMEQALIELEMA